MCVGQVHDAVPAEVRIHGYVEQASLISGSDLRKSLDFGRCAGLNQQKTSGSLGDQERARQEANRPWELERSSDRDWGKIVRECLSDGLLVSDG
jgi:hypothetical protein